MTVISYPIPLYANVSINAQFYKPSRFVISAITQGKTTIVTTSEAHNYVVGQLVRLLIAQVYGIRELNNTESFVLSIPSTTQVELNIDSSFMTPFTNASSTNSQPQILAIGEVNTGISDCSDYQDKQINIPGSFINISPN